MRRANLSVVLSVCGTNIEIPVQCRGHPHDDLGVRGSAQPASIWDWIRLWCSTIRASWQSLHAFLLLIVAYCNIQRLQSATEHLEVCLTRLPGFARIHCRATGWRQLACKDRIILHLRKLTQHDSPKWVISRHWFRLFRLFCKASGWAVGCFDALIPLCRQHLDHRGWGSMELILRFLEVRHQDSFRTLELNSWMLQESDQSPCYLSSSSCR